MMQHISRFGFGDFVFIDGDESIKASIVQVGFTSGRIWYELGWVANGCHQTAWVDEFRLSPANKE